LFFAYQKKVQPVSLPETSRRISCGVLMSRWSLFSLFAWLACRYHCCFWDRSVAMVWILVLVASP